MPGDLKDAKALSVLIVDDSPVMRSFIRRVMALAGFAGTEVHEAHDGASALDVLRAYPVDLVLSDINMPGMNGSELLRNMRAEPAFERIPVIVVSTDSSRRRVETMRDMGADGYLSKPFQPELLRGELERVFGL